MRVSRVPASIIVRILRNLQVPGTIVLVFGLLSSACVYRFTNQHVRLPNGVRSIAVEAIYDTSREVIPHELLWEALQRSFAADGHLQVVSQGSADAILRAHLIQASDSPIGSASANKPEEDNNRVEQSGAFAENRPIAETPSPTDFTVLPEAGEFTTKQAIKMQVAIEIIDLNTRAVLFTKNYSDSGEYNSFRSETTIAQKKTHYLMYEEARNARIKDMSNRIAAAVVRDFLVGR